ncbi:unnamed protein product [Lactuca virosa]|uniref:Uncharacterized protein n=1 Tax=Lactuca virosa TaxID=75947 RepID=A0AAU9LAS7_9ASTR|nr:unnamed protein product [Lactuca virosa]
MNQEAITISGDIGPAIASISDSASATYLAQQTTTIPFLRNRLLAWNHRSCIAPGLQILCNRTSTALSKTLHFEDLDIEVIVSITVIGRFCC